MTDKQINKAIAEACECDAELGLIARRDHCFIWETTARERAEAFIKTIGKWEE